MNIAVIGLGSMGKRRIRLIKRIIKDSVIFGIDNNIERQNEISNKFDIETYASIDNIKEKIDVAFVCTSPLTHSRIINECLLKRIHVFTEINLVDDMYDDNINLARNNNLVLFLSSTPMYKKEMQKINEIFHNPISTNYIYHVGQYLPDWHPWESYNDFFVSNKRTNGCREIMAIEFPWIINLFGKVKKFNVIKNKITNLNISYDDNYLIQFEHENDNKGTVVIDIVSPKGVRKLEIYNENKYISWDGTPDLLIEYNRKNKENITFNLYNEVENIKGYNQFVVENAYEEEIRFFFRLLDGNNVGVPWSFEKDKEMLKLIDKIEGI